MVVSIGDETRIGTFVEIQVGAKIGSRCKISSHTFICEGVTIEDEVFVGHGVMFINDRFPSATTEDGKPQGPATGRWNQLVFVGVRRLDQMPLFCVGSPLARVQRLGRVLS